jgi:hypothetical protein
MDLRYNYEISDQKCYWVIKNKKNKIKSWY